MLKCKASLEVNKMNENWSAVINILKKPGVSNHLLNTYVS